MATTGPNPLCEVGRRHPRDRHRMRPVEGQEYLWYCSKHTMYAVLADKDDAESVDRGSERELPNGVTGVVMGTGDERQGGVVLYVRAS